MWTLVVLLFALVMGLLIRHAIRLGRPRALVFAPIALLLFTVVFGGLNYLRVQDEMNRPIVRSLSEIRADQTHRPLLIAAKLEEGGQGDWAYSNATSLSLDATAVLVDGPLGLRSSNVYGERISHSAVGIRRGAEFFIDGEAHAYTDGKLAVHHATVYARPIDEVRSEVGLARWPLLAGVVGSIVGFLYFMIGMFRWKRNDPAPSP